MNDTVRSESLAVHTLSIAPTFISDNVSADDCDLSWLSLGEEATRIYDALMLDNDVLDESIGMRLSNRITRIDLAVQYERSSLDQRLGSSVLERYYRFRKRDHIGPLEQVVHCCAILV